MASNDKSETLIAELTAAVECTLQAAERFYSKTLPRPTLDFGLKGQCAGQMCASQHFGAPRFRLRLNLTLAKAYQQAFIEDVIPHEIAHLIIMHRYGLNRRGRQKIRPHGLEWQQVMHECFQRPATLYHTFLLPAPKRRTLATYRYKCLCREHQLSSIRHNRAQRQGVKYLCNFCRQPLTSSLDKVSL